MDCSYRLKLEKAIYYAKVVKLSVLNSDIRQRSITINAIGAESSLRGSKDGITFFGSRKRNSPKGLIVNDVILPFFPKQVSKKNRGRHFKIFYDVVRDTYFIVDLRLGFGTFVKLVDSIEIKNNTLFQVGSAYLQASFIQQEDSFFKLQLKVYGNGSGDVFYFNASEYSENYISIGRHEKCEIRLNGSLISKHHCTVFFTPEKGWILYDGNAHKHQPSTNGTWVYISENTEVYDSMVFKSGKIVFKAEIL